LRTHRISSTGIIVADVIAGPVADVPAGSTLRLVDDVTLHVGGSALNTAWFLAAWGQEVAVHGVVGADPLGDWLVDAMHTRGLDPCGVLRARDQRTSASVVLVDPSGERAFLHCVGANAVLGPDRLDSARLLDAEALHVAGVRVLPGLDGAPLAELLGAARRRGLLTSVDTTFEPSGDWSSVHPALRECDVFAPAIEEARAITGVDEPGEACEALVGLGVRRAAVTMGAQGCWVADRDECLHVPARTVAVVDTTGAGDAFSAGFLLGTLAGWSLSRAAELATAAGALATTRVGATGGAFDLPTTLASVACTPG
jgi:sugar/nucleoside kinase (ribokinase family)